MRPNWPLLLYLAALAAAISASVLLASLRVGIQVLEFVLGTDLPVPGSHLVASATVAIGALTWPGLAVLALALLRPTTATTAVVRDAPVGSLAVAVIALNEEQAIQSVVRGFKAAPQVASVIVVDNGSTDRTASLAAAAGAHVVSEAQRGYGFACMRALREGVKTGLPVVALCEGDMTFRAADLEKLTAYLKHADLAVGSRTHPDLFNGDSQLNSFFVLGNVFLGKLLQFRYWDWTSGGRVRLTDVGCTYMAFRTAALERILPALEVGGHHFVPHVLMVAVEHGLRAVQIPITFWKRVGASKGGNASWWTGLRLGLVMIWHILTYRVRRGAAREPRPESLRPAVSPQRGRAV
jgi:hypothetical protein